MTTGLWKCILAAPAVVAAVPTAAAAQELDPEMLKELGDFVLWGGVAWSIVVIAVAWVLLRLTHRFVIQLSKQFARFRLLLQKVETFFQFFVYVVVAISCVSLSFKLDDRVLAVIGGTLAVSIGFAMKDLVASVVAGIVVMIDRPFHVGDRIQFEGHYGDVISIGLRSIRIQTLDDNVVTVPNSKFLSDVVSSGNYGALEMQVTLDFVVEFEADVDAARRIVHDAAISSRFVYLPRPVVVHVARVVEHNYAGLRLRLKAYVLDTQHEMAFGTDVTLRVVRAFREAGIRMAGIRIQDAGDSSPKPPTKPDQSTD